MGSSCICPTNQPQLAGPGKNGATRGQQPAQGPGESPARASRRALPCCSPKRWGPLPGQAAPGPAPETGYGRHCIRFHRACQPDIRPEYDLKRGQMLYRAVAQRRQAPRRGGGRRGMGIRGRSMRPRPPGRLALPPARWAPYAPTPRPPGALGPRGRSGGGHRGASSDFGQERTQQRLELGRAFLLRRVAAVGQDFEATAGNTGL